MVFYNIHGTQFLAKQKPIEVSDDEDFRCYFCRTDVARIKHEGVRNLINQYLTGDFDTSAVNENCDGRGNTSLMHNEPCPVRACLKIIVDDKKGIPFIIRGCASTFFGLTPAQFAEQNAKPEYANKFSSCQITPSEWHYEHCFCQESLCNGAQRRNPLTHHFFLVTSISSLIVAVFDIYLRTMH
uniref:Uncharacterized protein n=1 Tax=Plectus sambesii TaxID=2011161 RepID=A0A914WZU6_9BILA